MSSYFIGEIRLFAFAKTPQGWAPCNGQTLAISGNEALYAVLGTTYGGDGRTNFKLPNLNGRLPIGQGQGAGLPNYILGSTGGSEAVTLEAAAIPAHSHVFTATTAQATLTAPGPTALSADDSIKHYAVPSATSTWSDLAPEAVETVGGNAAHNNVMPSVGLNYFIAIIGEYPQKQ
jgi:microcystin-dependent protein